MPLQLPQPISPIAKERCKSQLKRIESLLCDGGYSGATFASGVRELLGDDRADSQTQRTARPQGHPKRWIVERSFAWLEKCRRLRRNCERKLNASLQFVWLAFWAFLLERS